MFVNLSNHRSKNWSEKQIEAAREYGEIIDIPFPNVDPYWSEKEIDDLVEVYLKKILGIYNPVVMIQGEFSFTYKLINRCKEYNIKVVTSCSKRKSSEYKDKQGITHKESLFEFIQFREY